MGARRDEPLGEDPMNAPDPEAPPPPVDEEWEVTRADGDPAENMEGQAPTG